jgi:hypothetical protein
MFLVVILPCLFGVGLVAAAQRRGVHAGCLRLIGGGLIVVGLVGLGFLLARSR